MTWPGALVVFRLAVSHLSHLSHHDDSTDRLTDCLFSSASQGYLYFWRDEGGRAPLSAEQAVALFGNVDDIYRFNSQFLTQLQSCGLDPVEVARCFVRNNSGFTIYTDYCTNYPRWAIGRLPLIFLAVVITNAIRPCVFT